VTLKRGLIICTVLLTILFSPMLLAQECRDGIDNDGDGYIDALVETPGIPKAQWVQNISQMGSKCSDLCSTIGGTNIPDENHYCTAGEVVERNAIAQLGRGIYQAGCWNNPCTWEVPVSYGVVSVGGYCYPSHGRNRDNDATDLTAACSCSSSLTTATCNNGIDDDGDGKRDFCNGSNAATCDSGCASLNDNSEIPHDPDCTNPNDDEDPAPECSDGEDNNNNNLFDFCRTDGSNSATCDPNCDSPNDDNEEPQCSDGIDNNNNGLFDFCRTDGSNFATCEANCDSPNDNDEFTPLCDLSQTILIIDHDGSILPLSENSNGKRICYDYTFDTTNNDPDATQCTGDNIVLKINPETGLASIPETINTDLTEICYDNLVCNSISSGSCAADEFTTVRLSAETEAAIGIASSTLPIQICCKIVNPEISGAYWSEAFRDQKINFVNLNSLVKLRVNGVAIDEKDIDFTIKRRTGGFLDFLIPDITVSFGSVQGITSWRAGSNEDGDLQGGEYYFNVKIEELGLEFSTLDNLNEEDKYLVVSDIEENSKPSALIKFPIDKQIYFFNSPIKFEQESYDVDDGFSYVWDFGEGETFEGNSDTLENYIFDYTFDDENNIGQKTILLTVTDDRGESDSTSVTILVINSKFLLAYIDNPINGESFGREVSYDATSSYAVDSETIMTGNENECTKEVTCLGGNCPSQTFGVPTSQSLGCDYIGVGPIQVINAPATPSAVDFSEINFCWFFEEDSTTPFCEFGNGGATFDRTFATPGFHTSTLRVAISE